jgi:hypothetical protein
MSHEDCGTRAAYVQDGSLIGLDNKGRYIKVEETTQRCVEGITQGSVLDGIETESNRDLTFPITTVRIIAT